jgi:LysR family nitrogen assimilation transcriptional regulator
MPHSIANILLTPLLRTASEQLPKVRLQVFQEPRQALPDRILSGRLDFGLIVYPSGSAGLRQIPLMTEELLFVCHPKARVARGPVDPKAISQFPLILPTRENRLRAFVESLFLVHSLALDVRYEVDAIGHFVDCVEEGLAATILPASCVARLRSRRRIEVHSIADAAFRRTVTFASADARPLGIAATHAAALLQDLVKATVSSEAWHGAELA